MNAEMNAEMKLKRFAFLGSFQPVYTHKTTYIKVGEDFPIIIDLVREIQSVTMEAMLKNLLTNCILVRRDETLFIYAVCLAFPIEQEKKKKKREDEKRQQDEKQDQGHDHAQDPAEDEVQDQIRSWKKDLRLAFTRLILTDEDLFLFCKYASLIRQMQNQKFYSRTVRKAIRSWYDEKPHNDIRRMWSFHRGLHGITHKNLIRLCHISDISIGSKQVGKSFFKTCTRLLNAAAEPVRNEDQQREPPDALILAISKLRTTKKRDTAFNIIRRNNLSYSQVPGHLLKYPLISELLVPNISYLHVLKLWRRMHIHFDTCPHILRSCEDILENMTLVTESRIYPIHLLINLHKIAKGKVENASEKKAQSLRLNYLRTLYKNSFDWPIRRGHLRMHITLNLDSFYKKRVLRYQHKTSYLEACKALSFGFCKREADVDVFYYEKKAELKKIEFDVNQSIDYCFHLYENATETKNSNPFFINSLLNASKSDKIYDVLLCIVPTSGRGNPRQCSDELRTALNNYRLKKNPTAKFIILQLLKLKPSIKYSANISENILEISGLDDHTLNIMYNFIHNNFN